MLFAALNGIIALWAAHGGAFWFWRYFALVSPVALLAAVPALDLVVVYVAGVGSILAITCAESWIARIVTRRRNQEIDQPTRCPRFGLSDALLAVALIGVLLAGFRSMSWRLEFTVRQLCVVGISFSAVALMTYWATCATRWPLIRWILVPVCAIVLSLFWGALKYDLSRELLVEPFARKRFGFDGRNVAIFGGQAAAVGGWLLLAIAGRLLTTPAPRAVSSRSHRSKAPSWSSVLKYLAPNRTVYTLLVRPRWWTIAAWALFMIYLAPIAAVYAFLVRPVPRPPAVLPSPNGYGEVAKAVDRLDWSAIPDVREMTDDASARQFATANAAVFDKVSDGLHLPAFVPPELGARINLSRSARNLADALSIDAWAAVNTGQIDRAMRRHLEQIQLSQVASQGGWYADYLFASMYATQGAKGLRSVLDRLDFEQCKIVAEVLGTVEERWEPMSLVTDREEAEWWNTRGWVSRVRIVVAWLQGDSPPYLASFQAFEESRTRLRTILRLLQVEVGLRRFEMDHSDHPTRLSELAPRYLPSVPDDPYDGQPLRYKRLKAGHRLYSVGPNIVDNGGQVVSTLDALSEGDFFLEAWDLDEALEKAAAAEAAKEAVDAEPATEED